MYNSDVDTSTKKRLLQGVPLFSSLSDSDLSIMASITNHKSFETEETIFSEGDPGGTLFLIITGRVFISVINSHGKEVMLNLLDEEDHFGEISLLDGKPRSASATAKEDTELIAIDRDDFLRLIKRKPDFVTNIMAALTLVIRNLTDQKK